jgi:hypothetical protein
MTTKTLRVPSTRNHRQLATWINAQQLVDDRGRPVEARVDRVRTSTDQKIRGTRLRRPGKGRQGLILEIWRAKSPAYVPQDELYLCRLFRHESSETYRRHSEARAWVAQHLRYAS